MDKFRGLYPKPSCFCHIFQVHKSYLIFWRVRSQGTFNREVKHMVFEEDEWEDWEEDDEEEEDW